MEITTKSREAGKGTSISTDKVYRRSQRQAHKALSIFSNEQSKHVQIENSDVEDKNNCDDQIDNNNPPNNPHGGKQSLQTTIKIRPLNERVQMMKKMRLKERAEERPNESNATKGMKEKESKKVKPQTKVDVTKVKTIQLRKSPKVLHSTMQNLKNAHKDYVRSIGLGHLLEMKVGGSPTKIGYYVVKNSVPKKMVMKVKNGEIKTDRVVLHKLLGLPLRDLKIHVTPPNQSAETFGGRTSCQYHNHNNIE
ncbi:hypothetical protein LXL04_035789 [Taraxacum kok-saghyz]